VDDRSTLLEIGLERAAEVVGDITGPVIARFYQACPDAREAFERHAYGRREKLEALMVDNALYWVMNWFERRDEIAIQVGSSVPHHEVTLKVAAEMYRALVEAVVGVIAETIPADRTAELALWSRVRAELGEMISASSEAPGACAA
jgi:hypothetical protein